MTSTKSPVGWRSRLNPTFVSLLLGQVSAQVFGLLGIVLIPHFYNAADFGVFSLLMAANFILQPLLTFRLETALLDVTAGTPGVVFRLAVVRTFKNWLVLAALGAAVGWAAARAFHLPLTTLAWFIVIAASYASYILIYSLLLAQQASRQVAVIRLAQAATFFVLMMALSFLQWGFHALALAYFLSFLMPAALFGTRARAVWRGSEPLDAQARSRILSKYSLNAMPQSLLNISSQYLLNFVISRFGLTVVGQFAYAQRLGATVQTTLGETFRQFAFIKYRQRLEKGATSLRPEVLKDTLLLGSVIAVVLALFPLIRQFPAFKAFFAGQDHYLLSVLLWYCSMLANVPANVAANVLGLQQQLLFFEFFTLLVRGSIALFGLRATNADFLIQLFCYASVAINAAFILYLLWLIGRKTPPLQGTSLTEST